MHENIQLQQHNKSKKKTTQGGAEQVGLSNFHVTQWRRKMAKPGGANLLIRKYLYGKKSYGIPLKQTGLQSHSPTLSAAYDVTY